MTAWNLGFAATTGDVLYCFSSETMQAEGNLAQAKMAFVGETFDTHPVMQGTKNLCLHGSVSCSCGSEGTEVNWNGSAPGNLFCDAAHPRPLGFIWAAPAWAVKQIQGYDEAFAAGFWYDDNDFFFRLWQTGLDFVFDDAISGVHLHHHRPTLDTEAGRIGIARNQVHMFNKYGTVDPMGTILLREERVPGRTAWRHA